MPRRLSRYFGKLRSATGQAEGPSSKSKDIVTIVSGLPRSGTSMMMKMLEAGGIPSLTDGTRTADADNPEGYYEFERVKQLSTGDVAWLEEAQGKTVKVIAALLQYLPPGFEYKVIFMRRNMGEILRSQKQMLIRRGESPDRVKDDEMAMLFRKHLQRVMAWMAEQPNFEVLYVHYAEALENPGECAQTINHFLGDTLDVEKMLSVVDPSLYRQRE